MMLKHLINLALDKNNFSTLNQYFDFCEKYLEFIQNNLQAVIVSRNENNYRFLHSGKEINPHKISIDEFLKQKKQNEHFVMSVLKSPKIMIKGNEGTFRKVNKINLEKCKRNSYEIN